jgi:sulfur carrier protein ThiS
MRVTVAAYGELRRHLLAGRPQHELELPAGATLADVASALGVEPEELALARRGDSLLKEGVPLAEGDRIELFAPVGGG